VHTHLTDSVYETAGPCNINVRISIPHDLSSLNRSRCCRHLFCEHRQLSVWLQWYHSSVTISQIIMLLKM